MRIKAHWNGRDMRESGEEYFDFFSVGWHIGALSPESISVTICGIYISLEW